MSAPGPKKHEAQAIEKVDLGIARTVISSPLASRNGDTEEDEGFLAKLQMEAALRDTLDASELAETVDLQAAAVPGWQREFGLEYDCPPLPEGMDDLSWHNDASPSYGFFDGKTGEALVRLWISHPDPMKGEFGENDSRFYVCVENSEFGCPFNDDEWDRAVTKTRELLPAARAALAERQAAVPVASPVVGDLTPSILNKAERARLVELWSKEPCLTETEAKERNGMETMVRAGVRTEAPAPEAEPSLADHAYGWWRGAGKEVEFSEMIADAIVHFFNDPKNKENLLSGRNLYTRGTVDSFEQAETLYLLFDKELFDREGEINAEFSTQADFDAYMDGLAGDLIPKIKKIVDADH